MIQKYNYWFFDKALSDRTCDHILRYGKQFNYQQGQIGGLEEPSKLSKKQFKDLKNKRKSDVTRLSANWIFREIHPYIHSANKKAGWNFQWDHSEAIQFTKYEVGEHYGWHADGWQTPYNRPHNLKEHGKIRKLSVTCQLTDPSEYKGGELEFKVLLDSTGQTRTYTCKEALPKGSIIVFPSYTVHKVKPVTAGTRYSLVLWNLGWPFK